MSDAKKRLDFIEQEIVKLAGEYATDKAAFIKKLGRNRRYMTLFPFFCSSQKGGIYIVLIYPGQQRTQPGDIMLHLDKRAAAELGPGYEQKAEKPVVMEIEQYLATFPLEQSFQIANITSEGSEAEYWRFLDSPATLDALNTDKQTAISGEAIVIL
ncbi:hypothetical protein [Ferrovibrio sp.]|uniref:hypothetical protein n=1 Tax=Ferrovibrio sp. TaxID=1917215 RepID=UPI000CBB6AA0|nr:hypothetical protein [Ferrovibrio sp.]PJI40390.1 MAG: hypothetical protein CTR53_10290 [Ferrovibrio sp.]